jgi:integrating conjugative element protein (TIGR03757 family)
MHRRLLFLALSFALGCAFAAQAGAASIRVYTDRTITLRNTQGAEVVFLDAPQRLEQALSAGLPTDARRAEAIAQERLRAGGLRLQRDFARAWQGVIDARRLGIMRLPAVVADERYVVYGEPDVAKAAIRIAAFRSRQP